MFTLRCTQKLLRRGLTESPTEEAAPTTLLGDWYASVLVTRPQHLVLCISERTLLPVVVPAKGIGTLPARLVEALSPILAALSIPPDSVQAECERMREHRVGRTASRRVLGTHNELMFLLEHSLHYHPERPLLNHSLQLAQTPCKGIEYSAPDRATQALFMSSAAVAKARETARQ
ncbi:MAG: hypothetical protein JNJ89_11770 [Rubrivivax sp.]|nr:hypothetical protein [Rubrivivax sp.]